MSFSLPDFRSPVLYVAVLIVGGLCLKAILGGTFGQVGSDSDDAMRLVQIRDFLAGQSWFDVTQTRMGLAGGTDMHWSRVADIPILCLTFVFDLFLPATTAESLAISLWPPFSALIVIWGVLVGVRHLAGERWEAARNFALVLLVFGLILHYRFAPGSIDHHNLQLGLMSVAIGYALDPASRFRSGLISGVALALAVAVGVEVYAFVAVICSWFAIVWWLKGEIVKPATIGFGTGFGLALLVAFIATVPPAQYALVACDALSLITVSAAIAGGMGLALAARFASRRDFKARTIALSLVGAICGVVLIALGPQCLANPLNDLPPAVKTLWLGEIAEARPLFADRSEWFYLPPYTIGTSCVALIILVLGLKADIRQPASWLLAALLFMSLVLTIYQIRFYVFGSLFAIMVLAPWVAAVYTKSRESDEPSVGYILALAISIPLIWGFPAVFLKTDSPEDIASAEGAKACFSDKVMTAMNELSVGKFVVTSNGTSHILMHTGHSTLSGNYHRNVPGISANIKIFTSPAPESRQTLSDVGADYLHLCRTTKESQVFAEHNPDGLMANLLNGDVPPFLEPIGGTIENGAVTLYRVRR